MSNVGPTENNDLPPQSKPAKVINALNFGKEKPPEFDTPIEIQIEKKRNSIINQPYAQVDEKRTNPNDRNRDMGTKEHSLDEDEDAEDHFLPLNLAYTMLPPVCSYGKFNIVLGPIIGEVTTTSARILLEVDRRYTITCTLKPTTQLLRDYMTEHNKELREELNDPDTVYISDNIESHDLTLGKHAVEALTKKHPKIGEKLHWNDTTTHANIVHDSNLGDRPTHNNIANVVQAKSVECKLILNAYRVGVFKFENLQPDTKYDVYFSGTPATDDTGTVQTDIDREQEHVLVETLANEMNATHLTRTVTLKQAELKRNELQDEKYNTAIQVARGRLSTFVKEPQDMRFAVLSCNQIATDHKKDMWQKLACEVKNEKIDIICHIGDQIYADHSESVQLPKEFQDVWNISIQWLKKDKHENWHLYRDKILFLYRQLYRTTFSHSPTQFILSHVSNLMVFDDHDAHDDWGTDKADVDRSTPEWYVGKCAYRTICEYQHQQWKDINFVELDELSEKDQLDIDSPLTRDYHKHKYGQIGIYMSDNRGNQSIHYGEHHKQCPFLGQNQWDDINAAFEPNGYFTDCNILVMNFPVPLVYLPHNLNDTIARVYDDALGHWSSAEFRREQIRMLDLLRNWIDERPRGQRQVILTGGDVHIGGHTEIYYNDKLYFHQIICSAVSNNPLPTAVFFAVKTVASMVSHLDYGWTFKHHGFHKGANYGIVHCSYLDNQQPIIFSQLVTWSRKHQIHVSTVDANYYTSEDDAAQAQQELTVKPEGGIRSEIKKIFHIHKG